MQKDFLDNGLIVVDDFFCAEALQELWLGMEQTRISKMRRSACFSSGSFLACAGSGLRWRYSMEVLKSRVSKASHPNPARILKDKNMLHAWILGRQPVFAPSVLAIWEPSLGMAVWQS